MEGETEVNGMPPTVEANESVQQMAYMKKLDENVMEKGAPGVDREYEDYVDDDGEGSEYGLYGIPDVPDDEKTPVTIVTGFLGAGKTTLVNYILKEQREMKIAVIENEFGAVSIDTDLVSENVQQNEDIITMENGCVCCTVRGDLLRTLIDFLDKRKTFDCILLETTGIADPSPIVETFNQDLDVKVNYRVDSVLCMVDAKNIVRQLNRKPTEARAVNEAAQQLAFADTVVINKTDLVTPEELTFVKDRIHSVNAFAKVMQTEKSRVDLSSILNLKSFNLERTLELLEQEAKEEEAREKAEAEAKAKAKADGHDKGHDHDHSHSHSHDHNHSEGGHDCGFDHGDENGSNGNENGHSNTGEKRKNEDGGSLTKAPAQKKTKVSSTRHDSNVGSLGLTLDGELDVDMFNEFMGDFLAEHSQDLFRSKGVLAFAGQDQKFVFQGVHEQIKCEASPVEWPEDGTGRQSKIVFIGLSLDKDKIVDGINKCRV